MSDQSLSEELIAKIKNQRMSIQTHDYDGYLGEIYHRLSKTASLSFEASLDLIEIWMTEAEHKRQNLQELKLINFESLQSLQGEKLQLLDLTALETQQLTTWQDLSIPDNIKSLLTSRINVRLQNIPNLESCRKTLNLLRTDLKGNWDQFNRIEVSILLPQVVDLIKESSSEIHQEFLISLADIIEYGPCAQGRTSRLLNFYIPYTISIQSDELK